ncbi:MAG: hypothetical protein K6F07_00295 [Bacilli bacterium]|nr:hypothetical protein [Bacilli bacterium]
MKSTTKRTISNLFASLIKNDRAIEGAKTAPWWVAVILFVLGTFLPVIPIMVSQGNDYGAKFLNTSLYGYDQALVSETVAMNDDGFKFEVVNGELLAYKDNVQLTNTWENDNDCTPIATYDAKKIITGIDGNPVEVTNRVLNIFYTDRLYKSTATTYTITTMLKAIQIQTYVTDQINVVATTAENEASYKNATKYIPSFVLLHKGGIFSYIYKSGTTALASYTATGYSWKSYGDTSDLFGDILNNVVADKDVRNLAYVREVTNNWKTVYNKAYAQQKVTNFWFLSGIFYAIFFGLNAFMGLMLWLLCRGKNNPNRGLNILTCEGIAGWICVSPGLIAMVLGFIMPAAQQVAFIILIGLRAMWLAMRSLNPKY